ncbi:MAG: hypothetical protein NVSMB6_25940 [Burkholderiaceae bacterium]
MLSACSTMDQSNVSVNLLGDPAPLTAATRTVVIEPGTTRTSVIGGEVIRFMVDGRAFAWSFDGPINVTRVDLRRVAPAGMLNQDVVVYVAPNPMYSGGDNDGGR